MSFPSLQIHAGPAALQIIGERGLSADDVRLIAGAAGGPKGLILGPLDRFVFGQWLPPSRQQVHLLGASIGAWRMATAAMQDPVRRLLEFEQAYIHQHYEPEPGRKRPSAALVSRLFGHNLREFFGDEVHGVLHHPRYRVHMVTTRGRHLLRREGRLRTPAGYLGLALSNALSRNALNAWVERVVFSAPGEPLPMDLADLSHRVCPLSEHNFHAALQASCSIPFVLQAVHDIAGAPAGAYWDGGITDYHLHWRYRTLKPAGGLVLYPHFQRQLVPGWLDKPWKRRHRATGSLDNVVVLSPHPDWVKTLPNAKLPDRKDFDHYGHDAAARARDWSRAVQESQRLADEFAQWLQRGSPVREVLPLE